MLDPSSLPVSAEPVDGLIKPRGSIVIRRYEDTDLQKMVEYIADFLKEAPHYAKLGFDPIKMRRTLIANQSNSLFFCNLAVMDNEILGGLCGQLQRLIFSDDFIATDNLLYIRPIHRAMRAADKLIQSYVQWAKDRQVKRILIGATTGIPADLFEKFMFRHGFKELGRVYYIDP